MPIGSVSSAASVIPVTLTVPVDASPEAVTPAGADKSILSIFNGSVPYHILTFVSTGKPSRTLPFWSHATEAISLSISAVIGLLPFLTTFTVYVF